MPAGAHQLNGSHQSAVPDKPVDKRQLRQGMGAFRLFAAVLAALGVLYCVTHVRGSPLNFQRASKIDDRQITTLLQLLDRMEGAVGNLSAREAPKSKTNQVDGATREQEVKSGTLKEIVGNIRTEIFRNDLSSGIPYGILGLLGEVEADIDSEKVATTKSPQRLRKELEPALESLRARYFWTGVPGRWIEIAWWAEFGTLVGLLFYIAGCLGAGFFNREEGSMFFTEILITPWVVTVVFFLIDFTGMTSLKPNESSIFTTLGFSFILGFSIRRTVGLLDLIKKKILPHPSPEDHHKPQKHVQPTDDRRLRHRHVRFAKQNERSRRQHGHALQPAGNGRRSRRRSRRFVTVRASRR